MKRGKLRVLLGAAPGVGKTYEMLEEGRRLAEDGRDVVIAVVETHGRAATAALIDAGIDVITTVNVQHIESLGGVVEQITGVAQRETVPDAVVRAADQVEVVDFSPQSLRDRL